MCCFIIVPGWCLFKFKFLFTNIWNVEFVSVSWLIEFFARREIYWLCILLLATTTRVKIYKCVYLYFKYPFWFVSWIIYLLDYLKEGFGNIQDMIRDELSDRLVSLSFSLSRYKLKFSPDKVDTMVVQAIKILDELDKKINNNFMTVKQWYGWHFPELEKNISDNMTMVRTIQKIGMDLRTIVFCIDKEFRIYDYF